MTETKLTHLNDRGEAHMVDISEKEATSRTATAEGHVILRAESLELIDKGLARKGDVFAAARLAGIMAAKRTHELIPLCHPLSLSKVSIEFQSVHYAIQGIDGTVHITDDETKALKVSAVVKCEGKTGVEMEALTAASVACLTIYDMLKAVDRTMYFDRIRLVEKTGGQSGHFRASDI